MNAEYDTRKYDRHLVVCAAKKWARVIHKSDVFNGRAHMYAFAKFIGHPYKPPGHRIVDTTNPEVRRLIDLINGPSGFAILKIMEAKSQPAD